MPKNTCDNCSYSHNDSCNNNTDCELFGDYEEEQIRREEDLEKWCADAGIYCDHGHCHDCLYHT